MPESVNTTPIEDTERARKIAQIDKLAYDEAHEGLGRFPCRCITLFQDKVKPTTAELRARAVFYVKFPDEHTQAEHTRRALMAILDADPDYEPPSRWCVDPSPSEAKVDLSSHGNR